jgi:DNA-binding transcriptional MerR regulator
MSSAFDTERLYTITELAEELGLTPRAIRLYESKGLVKPRRAGMTRVYTYRERARLLIVLRGKRLGFSLADIEEYLDLYDADPTQTKQVQLLLDGVRERIDQLETQRNDLEMTLVELRDIEKQTLKALKERAKQSKGG